MSALITAIAVTLGVSAFCSLLEAFILSTTAAEITGLRKNHPRMGEMLERFKVQIDETSSAILTLNTVANTAGATVVGFLTNSVWPAGSLIVPTGMVLGILFFSEIVPKNIGVAYRKPLRFYLVYPIFLVRLLMKPFSLLAIHMISGIVTQQEPTEEEQEEEIRLLAERSVESGALSDSERDLITNALNMDETSVESIMTPRTVVSFVDGDLTASEVCRDYKNLPFARMPVYGESIDDILGIVRRRDILTAYTTEGEENRTMQDLMGDAVFIPETASALDALQTFLRKHVQLAVVVDEYGSTQGVVSMEDIVELLLGDEIYEESDPAVDMRVLALEKAEQIANGSEGSEWLTKESQGES